MQISSSSRARNLKYKTYNNSFTPFLLFILASIILFSSSASEVSAKYDPVSVTGAIWGSQQAPISVEPGTSNNPYTVYLTNFGALPLQNVKVTLSLKPPFTTSKNAKSVTDNINIIPPTATLSSTFYLNIAPDSPLGVYTLNLRIEYAEGSVIRNFTSSVKLPITTSANLSVQNVFWGSLTNPISVSAGTNFAPLILNVKNIGDNTAYDTRVTIHLAEPFLDSGGKKEKSVDLGIIPIGVSVPAQFTVNVASSISKGEYPLNITLNYNNGIISNQTVYVPVTTSPDLVIQSVYWGSPSAPVSVSAGTNYAPLILSVKNVGDSIASNASVTIHFSKPFFNYKEDNTVELGVIPLGAPVPAQFTVSVEQQIATGEYPLNITLTYNNGVTSNQVIYIPVLGSPKIVVQNYMVQQVNMFPGDNNVGLNVYLVNSGNSTASDVSVELGFPSSFSPSYPGSNKVTLGEVPIGEPVLVTFFFDVEDVTPSPSSYEFQISLAYKEQQAVYPIQVMVSSKADFKDPSDTLPSLQQGSSNVNLVLSLTNIGNTTAKSTQAQLLLPNQFTGTTFSFLGDVSPKISNIASFSLDTSSNIAPGTYYATLRIIWLQDNAPSRQFTQDISLSLKVNQSLLGDLKNNLTYIIIVIVVVIAGIVITVFYRRRK